MIHFLPSFLLVSLSNQLCLLCFMKEIVPTHLMTSPITTEEAVGGREGRCGESGTGNGQPLGPEDPSARHVQACSSTAGKKRKRRRKRHKAEARKEEQSAPAGGELEQCELSSDEEKTRGQWWAGDWRPNNHNRKPWPNHRVSSLQDIYISYK